MASKKDKKRKVIHTPFLLEGIKFPPIKNSPPPRRSNPSSGGGDNLYVITHQGFKLTFDAWSRNDKPLPTQIFLHHTAGHSRSDRGQRTVEGWNKRNLAINPETGKRGHGSTHCIIDKDGVLERCVPENRRCHSEGVTTNSRQSMSVELCALGWFDKKDSKGQWYRQEGGKVFCPVGEDGKPVGYNLKVINEKGKTGFRGFIRYQKYSKAMVTTTINLIKEWCYRYNIKFIFDEAAYNLMFPNFITKKAVKGSKATPVFKKTTSGVFSHNSVQPSRRKTDVYPDYLLVQALIDNFGPKVTTNPTVTAFNATAALPRDLPVWNPTKMEVGNYTGGWGIKDDFSQFQIQSPEFVTTGPNYLAYQ